ncbi:2-C-methyl-D-erythritol 4-phosphate cytidylyltransferase [Ferrimonas aestuarii]|uniref:2-C-methyl-D-erythritol 4-phosphate cytidylyltransferase n=1 Tax=Ferrimonas aestuarii TaxID=2569539 RepID=A0A4U1BND6_9GAMM|nr:2-C-methyl-D-erythritol 4-phosphate cytidylyltransferase [Ferrimonas aestuarii]TKB55433.1 2-C-methyl-D-erythritol 4-phosphate cytidylyltransferase [Ferrimonas aestuarii]
MTFQLGPVVAVVPAAGIGKRMGATMPKQYLPLVGKPILSHTLSLLLSHPRVDRVVVAINPDDEVFASLPEANHPKLSAVVGGGERADSVLSALNSIEDEQAWAMVHDAARPCLSHADIDALIEQVGAQGAILAAKVRDTMKRGDANGNIDHTVEREALWHALTPQLFPVKALRDALVDGLAQGAAITDEASAMERLGWKPKLVEGQISNLKVTHPSDLKMAELLIQETL